jgi:hypothetical protein
MQQFGTNHLAPGSSDFKSPVLQYQCSFLGKNQPGSETDHSPPSSSKGKDGWSYTSAHCVCLYCVEKELLYFTLLYFTLLYFMLYHFTSLHFTSLHFTCSVEAAGRLYLNFTVMVLLLKEVWKLTQSVTFLDLFFKVILMTVRLNGM